MTFIVKHKNRKVTKKAFASGFADYEAARNAARKEIRSKGGNSDYGMAHYQYQIVNTRVA